MNEPIDRRIWDRAESIFRRERAPDEEWGTVTADGRLVIAFRESEGPGPSTVALIGDARRDHFIRRAREEIEAEDAAGGPAR